MRIVFFVFLSPVLCYSQDPYSIRDLKAGKFKEDSSYIYTLPFENKKKVFLVQAYESQFSHKGERALDLHFEVQGYDAAGHYKQLATRFYTKKGVIYLRPGKFYRARR